MTPDEYYIWLKSDNPRITKFKDLGGGVCCYCYPLLYHWTVVVSMVGDTTGYFDRWCLQTQHMCETAIDKWDGTGDLPGQWHRHPHTGRRRAFNNRGEIDKEWNDD